MYGCFLLDHAIYVQPKLLIIFSISKHCAEIIAYFELSSSSLTEIKKIINAALYCAGILFLIRGKFYSARHGCHSIKLAMFHTHF